MNLEQLLRDGQYPNPTGNTTLAQAKDFQQFLAPFFPSSVVIVTSQKSQQAWPVLFETVTVEGFEIPADAKLNFALKVNDGGRDVLLGVANLQYVRANQGDRQSAIIALEKIIPDYAGKPELLAMVTELKPFVPPVVVADQPIAAMPDWDNPRTEGVLGSRVGDHSPAGTKYISPAGVVWEKGQWVSMFETTWKRV